MSSATGTWDEEAWGTFLPLFSERASADAGANQPAGESTRGWESDLAPQTVAIVHSVLDLASKISPRALRFIERTEDRGLTVNFEYGSRELFFALAQDGTRLMFAAESADGEASAGIARRRIEVEQLLRWVAGLPEPLLS